MWRLSCSLCRAMGVVDAQIAAELYGCRHSPADAAKLRAAVSRFACSMFDAVATAKAGKRKQHVPNPSSRKQPNSGTHGDHSPNQNGIGQRNGGGGGEGGSEPGRLAPHMLHAAASYLLNRSASDTRLHHVSMATVATPNTHASALRLRHVARVSTATMNHAFLRQVHAETRKRCRQYDEDNKVRLTRYHHVAVACVSLLCVRLFVFMHVSVSVLCVPVASTPVQTVALCVVSLSFSHVWCLRAL